MRWLAWLGTGLVIGGMGCQGKVGSLGSDPTPSDVRPDAGEPLMCESGVTPSASRRLARSAYIATLRDLVGPNTVSASENALAQIPRGGGARGAFSTEARDLSIDEVTALARVSLTVGQQFARSDELDPCFQDTPDEACISGFIADFGRRAYRGNFGVADRALLRAAYDAGTTPTESIELVVRTALQSPRFVYTLETGRASDPERVSDVELASRLSYSFWNTMPDDALLQAAEQDQLRAELASQTARLLQSARARDHFRDFVDEWLELDRLSPPAYSDAFLEGASVGELRQAAVQELLDFVVGVAFDDRGTFADLYRSTRATVSTSELGAVYEVAPSDEPQDIGDRAGLLTRVAFLWEGADQVNSVMRGVRVRRNLLCDEPPPPPPDAAAGGVEAVGRANLSTRDYWTAVTEVDTQCAGCHRLLNPLGFALGEFDALGRWTTLDRVFIEGAEVGRFPVEVDVLANVDGTEQDLRGVAELSEALATSPMAAGCFAERLYRFMVGRELLNEDRCVVDALRDELLSGAPIVEAWGSVAARDEFQRRFANTMEDL